MHSEIRKTGTSRSRAHDPMLGHAGHPHYTPLAAPGRAGRGDRLLADRSPECPDRAAKPEPPTAKAKAIIHIWLWGGPSHIDTFDPKPQAGQRLLRSAAVHGGHHACRGRGDRRIAAAAGQTGRQVSR